MINKEVNIEVSNINTNRNSKHTHAKSPASRYGPKFNTQMQNYQPKIQPITTPSIVTQRKEETPLQTIGQIPQKKSQNLVENALRWRKRSL